MDQVLMSLQAHFLQADFYDRSGKPVDKADSEITGISDVLDLEKTVLGFLQDNLGKKRKRSWKRWDDQRERVPLENKEEGELFEADGFTPGIREEPLAEIPLFAPSEEDFPLSEFILAADEDSYLALASKLRLVPGSAILRCLEFGSRFHVMKKEAPPELLKETLSSEHLSLPGGYVPRIKASYLWKEVLTHEAFENLPIILFAHAYDHCLGEDNFASLKSPAVHSLYLACKQRKSGHQFLSGYGEAGSVQYFAQSMAAFFSPAHTLWGRKALKKLDFSMHEYLACLFGVHED